MIHGLTDIGKKRTLNEDSFYFESQRKGFIMIVSDGMGGHNAGEVASSMAVKEIMEFSKTNNIFQDPEVGLRKAVSYANKKIYKASCKKATLSGMGATVVVAVGNSKKVCIANVGDSRAYLISKDKISQITKDHSYVYELVKNGLITPEEAKSHPRRNEILKALGIAPEVYPDIFCLDTEKTDKLLLCTDGLTSHVSDEEIFTLVNRYSRKAATEALVKLANENGGLDNITVVLR